MSLLTIVTLVSSAYPQSVAPGHHSSISLRRMIDIVGDNILPCGLPTFRVVGSDSVLPIMTCCDWEYTIREVTFKPSYTGFVEAICC